MLRLGAETLVARAALPTPLVWAALSIIFGLTSIHSRSLLTGLLRWFLLSLFKDIFLTILWIHNSTSLEVWVSHGSCCHEQISRLVFLIALDQDWQMDRFFFQISWAIWWMNPIFSARQIDRCFILLLVYHDCFGHNRWIRLLRGTLRCVGHALDVLGKSRWLILITFILGLRSR